MKYKIRLVDINHRVVAEKELSSVIVKYNNKILSFENLFFSFYKEKVEQEDTIVFIYKVGGLIAYEDMG